jgi:hypothetical protein
MALHSLGLCALLCAAFGKTEGAWDVSTAIKEKRANVSAERLTAVVNGYEPIINGALGEGYSANEAKVHAPASGGSPVAIRIGEVPNAVQFLSLLELLPANETKSKEANANAKDHLGLIFSPKSHFFSRLNTSLAATAAPAVMVLLNCPQYHLFQNFMCGLRAHFGDNIEEFNRLARHMLVWTADECSDKAIGQDWPMVTKFVLTNYWRDASEVSADSGYQSKTYSQFAVLKAVMVSECLQCTHSTLCF